MTVSRRGFFSRLVGAAVATKVVTKIEPPIAPDIDGLDAFVSAVRAMKQHGVETHFGTLRASNTTGLQYVQYGNIGFEPKAILINRAKADSTL